MNRYLLKFEKRGNMRFISHLDLARLFKRAIRKAEIKVAFSNGYNPHELINIVQPLSLGYESEGEYFEIDTLLPCEPAELAQSLNSSLPEGIRFTSCREEERSSKNLSFFTEYALYEAVLPLKTEEEAAARRALAPFLAQEKIFITKKDKKTKKPVEKDIKAYIRSFELGPSEGGISARMCLRCASNETLNPGKLLETFFKYCGIDLPIEECRITRKDMLAKDSEGRLVSAYEAR